VALLAEEGLEIVAWDNLLRVVVDLKIGIGMFFCRRALGDFGSNGNEGQVSPPHELMRLQLEGVGCGLEGMRVHCYFIWITV
jgi:hypothetical protein